MTERRQDIRVELWARGYLRPTYHATVIIGSNVRRFDNFSISSYDRLFKWCHRRAEAMWSENEQTGGYGKKTTGSYVFHVEV